MTIKIFVPSTTTYDLILFGGKGNVLIYIVGDKHCLSYFKICNYRVSPIIRPTRKIRPSVIFEDDFNVSPTLKISPS